MCYVYLEIAEDIMQPIFVYVLGWQNTKHFATGVGMKVRECDVGELVCFQIHVFAVIG